MHVGQVVVVDRDDPVGDKHTRATLDGLAAGTRRTVDQRGLIIDGYGAVMAGQAGLAGTAQRDGQTQRVKSITVRLIIRLVRLAARGMNPQRAFGGIRRMVNGVTFRADIGISGKPLGSSIDPGVGVLIKIMGAAHDADGGLAVGWQPCHGCPNRQSAED